MGQKLYSVLVTTFIVEILTSLAVDPTRKWFYEETKWFRKYLGTSRFQTIKCTLEMLWTQAIIWFGIFFCPLIAFLGAFKHFVLFYFKKYSTMQVRRQRERERLCAVSTSSQTCYLMLSLLFTFLP